MTDSSINSSKFDGEFNILNTGNTLGDTEFTTNKNPQAGNLQSRQFVTILDLLSEGEIAGFATPHRLQIPFDATNSSKYQIIGLKDVFLNKTPVLKSSAPDTLADIDLANHFNFGSSSANIPRTVSRTGTTNQTSITFLNQTERELINERVKVTKSTLYSQEIALAEEFDAVRVTLMFPSLFKENGDKGTTVRYTVQVVDKNDAARKTITSFSGDPIPRKGVAWYRWANIEKSGVTYAVYSFNFNQSPDIKGYGENVELRFTNFKRTVNAKRTVTHPNANYSLQTTLTSGQTGFNSTTVPPLNQFADKYVYSTKNQPTNQGGIPNINGNGLVTSDSTGLTAALTTLTNEIDRDNTSVTFKRLETFDTYSGELNTEIYNNPSQRRIFEEDQDNQILNPDISWPRQLNFDRFFNTLDDDEAGNGFRAKTEYNHQNSFKIAIPLNVSPALTHPEIGAVGTCDIESALDFRDDENTVDGGSVSGKTFSPYFKDHILNLTDGNGNRLISDSDYPIKIRVRRETADNGLASVQNDLFVSGITGLIARKDTYENSAYAAIRFDAEVFGSIPTRLYRIRGKKVKIPAENSIAVTAQYTQSGSVITINSSNHKLVKGDTIIFDATSGAGVDGTFAINSIASDGNSFTFINQSSDQTVSTSDCTYKIKPHVDLETGRINYPIGYIFSGSLLATSEWTSDPAWILYDLLTDTRVGMGKQVTDDLIDKFAFFEASKYNNELVTGTDNIQKPRFSFHKSFQTPTDAFSLLNQVAESMRASLFVSEGRISLSQDRPAESVYFFSYANVLEGGFGYTGPAQSSRDTIVNVKFFDNEKREFDLVTVNASDVIANSSFETLYGENIRNLEAVGCTDFDQAERFGRWHIFTQNNQADIVNFSTNAAAGTLLNPGDVITIQDPMKTNKRVSGRVSVYDSSTKTLTLDLFPDGVTSVDPNDKFFVILKTIENQGSITSNHITKLNAESDTESLPFIKKELTIFSINATAKTITFSDTDVGNKIQVNTVWVYEKASQAETQDYRIISISEQENVYSISAVIYDASKYSVIEGSGPQTLEPNQVLTTLVPPDNLQADESIIVEDNNAVSRLTVSWSYARGISSYLVTLTDSFEREVEQIKVFTNQYERIDLLNGIYKVRVQSINFFGVLDQNFNEISFEIKKSKGRPTTPQNLALNIVNDQEVNLLFSKSTDLDVFFGGNVQIDHLSNTTAPSDIRNAIGNIGTFDGNTDSVVVPNLPGIYVVKFEDNSSNLSAISTIVNSDFSSEGERQLKSVDEADLSGTPFNGTKTNCQYDSSKSALILTDPTVQNSGVYTFAGTLDLGQKTNVTIERILQATGYYPNNNVTFVSRSQISGLTVGQWASFSGLSALDGSVELLVQTTDGDPASANFTNIPFLPVTKSVFIGRGFKFTLRFSVTDNSQNIAIEKLGFKMSLKSRTERNASPISNVVSGNPASKTVTFDKAFYSGSSNTDITDHVPEVLVTIQPDSNGALQNNETVNITNVKSNEFTVDIKDSGGNFVTRNFNYSAVGFGTISS